MKEAVLRVVTEPDASGWLASLDSADWPVDLAGADLVFFRADAAEVLVVREVVLLILAAAGPETTADPEAAIDLEAAVDPEAADLEPAVDEAALDPEAAIDLEAAVDPEAAADLEAAVDPEATEEPVAWVALLVGFSLSSSAKDGSFSGHDLRMFS